MIETSEVGQHTPALAANAENRDAHRHVSIPFVTTNDSDNIIQHTRNAIPTTLSCQ
jgi:hypothetical protein